MVEGEPRFEGHSKSILQTLQNQGIDPWDVWVRYIGLTGRLDEIDVEAFLYGLMPLPNLERMLLMEGVCELLADLQ
ncbi:hypothetical protein [Arthrobacter sp. CP30]